MRTSRRPSFAAGPGALELIEEAVQSLRRAPPVTLAIYYAGTAPFVLGLLYFWAHATWFAPPAEELALGACGLTLAFALMKTAHAEFCGRLLAQRLGTAPPAVSAARLARVAAGQMRLQAWGLVVLPAALVTVLPFGWAYAFFQGVSVLGDDESAGTESGRQCQLWPAQNHLGLVLFVLLGLAAAINVAAAASTLPGLASSLLGIENLFGFTSASYGNSTFVASVFALAWLVVDPLVKAFYTLRVFHGRARATGADLRLVLHGIRPRARRGLAAAVVLFGLGTAAPVPVRAAGAPGPAAAVVPAELDTAIERVLAGPDFQWQLRPVLQPVDESTGGPITRFVRGLVKRVEAGTTWAWRKVVQAWHWLMDWLFPEGVGGGRSAGAVSLGALKLLLVVLVVVAVAVLGIVLWRRRKDYRRAVPAVALAAAPMPDLADERTRADQLTADGWLALAREQLARGDWRLAWRALYLGTLARLASDGLVTLARSKTNLDYEREVRRRAAGRDEVASRFAGHRVGFESVWYGRAEADEAVARRWLAELEGGTPS